MKNFFGSALGIGISVFVLVIGIFFVLDTLGLKINKNLTIVKSGKILINYANKDVKIFVDNKRKKNNPLSDTSKIKNVRPGTHSVLVSKDLYWPWIKEIKVSEDEEIILSPFFVLRNVDGAIITESDEEYKSIALIIEKEESPTEESKRISKNGNVAVWLDGNNVMAEWLGLAEELPQYFCLENECETNIKVLSGLIDIGNVDFYSGREDILILSSREGIFALEIDRRGIQNFQPIYKGTSFPYFSVKNDSSIYVIDGTLVFIVNI